MNSFHQVRSNVRRNKVWTFTSIMEVDMKCWIQFMYLHVVLKCYILWCLTWIKTKTNSRECTEWAGNHLRGSWGTCSLHCRYPFRLSYIPPQHTDKPKECWDERLAQLDNLGHVLKYFHYRWIIWWENTRGYEPRTCYKYKRQFLHTISIKKYTYKKYIRWCSKVIHVKIP